MCDDIDMLTRSTKSTGKSMNLFSTIGWSINWPIENESSVGILEIQLKFEHELFNQCERKEINKFLW